MKKNLNVKHVVLMVLLTVFFMACGESSDSSSGISYTGLTNKATIDENNAGDLILEAYLCITIATVFNRKGVIQPDGSERAGHLHMLKMSQILEDSLSQMELISTSGHTLVGTVHTDRDTIYGNCGGSAYSTIELNDQNGNFSGNFNYSNYCDDGVVISGPTTCSGQIDLNTGEFLKFTFSFNNLNFTEGRDSSTFSGDVSFNAATSSVTMTMYLKDNNREKVYWLRDYSITSTKGWNYENVEISGRYYAPDYGYVTIGTSTPLLIYDGDENPTSGVCIITGSAGISGGSTKARLTALSSTSFQVEADTNGDGTYNLNSGTLNWLDI